MKRSHEESARLRSVREQFKKTRPALEALRASGNYDVVRQDEYLSLLEFV